jgi:hypothetical protein
MPAGIYFRKWRQKSSRSLLDFRTKPFRIAFFYRSHASPDKEVSAMSDNQRRFICRLVFLLLCAAPTLTVGYRICHPQSAGSWARDIQSQLGVVTTIDSIETPGPYVTILRGVNFSDPELGTILNAMEVRIEYGETNRILIPHSVKLTNAGIIQLGHTVNNHLIRALAANRPWRIEFLKHTVIEEAIVSKRSGGQPKSLLVENLQVDIVPMVEGTLTQLAFQLPATQKDDSQPTVEQPWVICKFGRSHPSNADLKSQQWMGLNTNQVELPCWLLGDVIPEIQQRGLDCQFAGYVDINTQSGSPVGHFAGRFNQIDASALLDSETAIQTGNYQVDIKQCLLDGDIESLDAVLIHPNGLVSPIQESIEVVKQFNVIAAIRTAARSPGQPMQVDTIDTMYR